MAENPLTWDAVERTIALALEEMEEARKSGICGASTVKIIATRLRERGLCPEYDPSTARTSWDEPL